MPRQTKNWKSVIFFKGKQVGQFSGATLQESLCAAEEKLFYDKKIKKQPWDI